MLTRYAVWSLVLLLGLLVWPTSAPVTVAQASRPIVVISPGHGWRGESGRVDPGAVEGDLIEKDINLDVSKNARDYLARCPMDVHLTRDKDDATHSLEDVDDMVNKLKPTVALSIHSNSAGGNPSGVESWHTVGGHDDEKSKRLSELLAAAISEALAIKNLGIKPETDNRHGGLYIHYWQTPSALVEIGYLQGDAELLRKRRLDFGRAIASAVLNYLGIPSRCADRAVPGQRAIATYFPNEKKVNRISLLNDGLTTWQPADYTLKNVQNLYGASESYPLRTATLVGQEAAWDIPATAPSTPGLHRQVWRLHHRDGAVEPQVEVILIVFPEQMRDLKKQVDEQIERMRQRGEQELDSLLKEVERQIREAIAQEAGRLIQCIIVPGVGLIALIGGTRRSKRRGHSESRPRVDNALD